MSDVLPVMLAEAAELKRSVTELEEELKRKKDTLAVLSEKIVATLEASEVDSVRAHGFLFYIERRSSVTTPKTLEEKRALFDYLREQNIFDEMVSVNSQTLNSLYKQLEAEALERGELEFKLPGVAEPVTYTTLKMKRG